jgi:iron complex outermembrane receptor protein
VFHPRVAILTVCALLIVLPAMPASAQTAPGKIAGTVRVAAGAPVGGAPVTITNQDTGATRVVKSSATGSYELGDLAPGTYTVSTDVQGFRKVVQKDQVLAAGATVTVDFALEVRLAAEVTVTAMKREDTILTTPVSIAAPTEEVLRERGAENIEDVAANVANFSVQNLGPGQSQVAIRGVSSGQIARDQAGVKEQVGAYLDESLVSLSLFTPDFDLFDVGRVEVLRGPQGTLFGSGSLAGTVRYISNQPVLGQTKVFGELEGNTLTHGNQGGSVKLGTNVPLGNTAALRLVGWFDQMAGFQDAVQPNLSVDEHVNTGHRTGFRAAIEIAPNDQLTITPRFVYQDVKTNGWNRTDVYNILANPYTTTRPAVTLDDRRLFTQIGEPFTDKFYLGDLNIKYNAGPVTVTSITSYTHRDLLVVRDAGALTSSITGGSYGLPPSIYELNSPLDDTTTINAISQELRLSGGNDKLKWVVGGFYIDQRRAYAQDLNVAGFEETAAAQGIDLQPLGLAGPHGTAGIVAPKDHLYFSGLHYDLQQYAIFGEGTLAVTNKFSVTAGLRYYNFKESKAQVFDGVFNLGSAVGTTIDTIGSGSTSADGVAPRFIASYKVTEDTTINAQAAKGFRLGSINDPLNLPLCTDQDKITFGGRQKFTDETAWNYEIGSKSRLFGGKGSLGVSAFYVDIKDLQVTVTAGSCSSRLIFNVPKARSAGGEIEFAMTPNEHFDFSLSAGYNNSKLKSTVTSIDASGNVSVVSGIQDGARLPSVPQVQWSAAATYQTLVGGGMSAYLTGTYNHIGDRWTQVGDEYMSHTFNISSFGANTPGGPLTQNTVQFDPRLPAYDIVNARLGVRRDFWDIAFFVNNLTNERALLALDRERGFRARFGYLVNQPRTFGISSRFDF